MKMFLSIVLALIISFGLTSCQSKEEKVIDQLNKLAEKVEKNGANWDADQWEDALEDFQDIHQEMQNCEFTNEQLKELGEVEGRLTTVIMTEGTKAAGEGLGTFLQGAGAFMSGYEDGLLEGQQENIEKAEEMVKGALDELMQE